MALNAYLKIDGVDGESTDDKHKNEIDVESWSWGATNPGSLALAGGATAGKVQIQDFHFTMRTNKASPKLFQACATGQHIKSAILTARKAGQEQQEFLKVKFSDLLISGYQTGGAGGDIVGPTDSVAFTFGQIEMSYFQQQPDGKLGTPVIGSWDLKQNKKL